ncbi:MAG: hypothetical protein KatS3mg108_2032 [Isosphaeraceae bacterium]|nr:MAG: hypothetical protein KatS3mg108_2032 [Isosphaeraceae bacterium]
MTGSRILAALLLALPLSNRPAAQVGSSTAATVRPHPLPELSTWKSNMLSYGKKHADWLAAHRNDAKLDPVLAATYYDAARVFYQIADETGDPAWRTAAADAVFVYRDRYVLPNNGAVPGYWNFGKGLAEHFRRTGDVRSRDALFALADNAAYSRESTAPDVLTPVERSREVAYALMTRLEAEALGKPHSARTDLLYEKALGHVDQWVNNPTIYLQPFMVGLTCEALIAYHAATGDARALPAVQRALDMIWDRAWREAGGGFYYESTAPDRAAPDLNMLIAPAFGWVYRQTRQTLYRDRGDQVFAGGVRGAWLDGAKQFNQNYRWSFQYLKWTDRTSEDAPTRPRAETRGRRAASDPTPPSSDRSVRRWPRRST